MSLMQYNNEDVIGINERNILLATVSGSHIKVSKYLSDDEFSGDLTDVVNNLLTLSRGMAGAELSFEFYGEEEWSYILVGWRETTQSERDFLDMFVARRAATIASQEERTRTADLSMLRRLYAQYGQEGIGNIIVDISEEEDGEEDSAENVMTVAR